MHEEQTKRGKKHNGGSDDQTCLRIYWNQRNNNNKKKATVFSSDLFWFRLNDSKFWLSKPPVPYFFARLVLMRHRPQRWDPTSSHMRQFPSVSFWHTEHHLSELHFPPATASIQNQHCYLGDIVACHTQKEMAFDLIWFICLFYVADVPAALAAV